MSKIKVSAGWVSPEVPLLGLQIPPSLFVLMFFPLCMHIPGVSLMCPDFLFYKDISHIGLGSAIMASF